MSKLFSHVKTFFPMSKHSFPCQNFFPMSKHSFPCQNILSHVKTFFPMSKHSFPCQNFFPMSKHSFPCQNILSHVKTFFRPLARSSRESGNRLMASKMALPDCLESPVFKGKCDLNCQVFVLNERDSLSSKSSCVSCNHFCAFHEQNTEPSGRGFAAASSSTSNNQ